MKPGSSPLRLLRGVSRALLLCLALSLAGASCGGDDQPGGPVEIEHSTVGRWTGTTAGGNWIELTITAEGTDCCSRFASGSARIAAPASDTLETAATGLSQTGGVFFNLGGGGATFYGQFSGEFVAETRLDGTIHGPEAFGEPSAGPFPAAGEGILLSRD